MASHRRQPLHHRRPLTLNFHFESAFARASVFRGEARSLRWGFAFTLDAVPPGGAGAHADVCGQPRLPAPRFSPRCGGGGHRAARSLVGTAPRTRERACDLAPRCCSFLHPSRCAVRSIRRRCCELPQRTRTRLRTRCRRTRLAVLPRVCRCSPPFGACHCDAIHASSSCLL